MESCDDACLAEIEIRNRVIRELHKDIEQIYAAAKHLIEHAKNTQGDIALSMWESNQPAVTKKRAALYSEAFALLYRANEILDFVDEQASKHK